MAVWAPRQHHMVCRNCCDSPPRQRAQRRSPQRHSFRFTPLNVLHSSKSFRTNCPSRHKHSHARTCRGYPLGHNVICEGSLVHDLIPRQAVLPHGQVMAGNSGIKRACLLLEANQGFRDAWARVGREGRLSSHICQFRRRPATVHVLSNEVSPMTGLGV